MAGSKGRARRGLAGEGITESAMEATGAAEGSGVTGLPVMKVARSAPAPTAGRPADPRQPRPDSCACRSRQAQSPGARA
jgi:hypothetical protein